MTLPDPQVPEDIKMARLASSFAHTAQRFTNNNEFESIMCLLAAALNIGRAGGIDDRRVSAILASLSNDNPIEKGPMQ